MASKPTKKSSGLTKLTALIPRPKKNYHPIIILPDEIDDGMHWLFWLLLILIVVFLVSVVVIKYTDFPNTLSLLL